MTQPDPGGVIESIGRAVQGDPITALALVAISSVALAGFVFWLVARHWRSGESDDPQVVDVGQNTRDWAETQRSRSPGSRQGERGEKGEKGERGHRGAKGQRGPRGSKGDRS